MIKITQQIIFTDIPGIGAELTYIGGSCMGITLKRKKMSFVFEETPYISLSCKLQASTSLTPEIHV